MILDLPGMPRLALIAAALAIAGCAGGIGDPPDARAGLGCIDDSPECISRRAVTLRTMVDDKNRAWVNEAPTPEAYASGVRLFAFKTKKKELTCDELAVGKREADNARTAMKAPGNTLTHSQVARGAILATEVSRELAAEMGRRCKKA